MGTYEQRESTTLNGLTSSAADSRASLLVPQADERARQILAGSGRKCFELYGISDRARSWRKTLLESLLLNSAHYSTRFSHRWKLKTMSSCRLLFQLQRLERGTKGIASLLLPTLTVIDATLGAKTKKGQKGRHSVQLAHMANSGRLEVWPTLRANERGQYQRDRGEKGKERLTLMGQVMRTLNASDWKNRGTAAYRAKHAGQIQLQTQIGGPLNPEWCEWYMGFPIGWTALKDSETPSSPKSRSGLEGES
jgi:hypothetical protein